MAKSKKVTGMENFLEELKYYQHLRILYNRGELKKSTAAEITPLRTKLLREVGVFSSLITELTGKEKIQTVGKGTEYSYDMWAAALRIEFNKTTLNALRICIDYTDRAIGKLKSAINEGIRDEQGNRIDKSQQISTEPPKAFIAHEGETKALDKLKAFLDALGVTYLIAEIESSNGRLVEGQVDWSQGQADFAIILATKGKVVSKKTGKPQIGTNVADELGRARQVFKNRIILLIQTGVEVHTNVSGIIHERFSPQSIYKAFTKIARELTNWGFITARAKSEHSSEDDIAPSATLI